MIEPHNILIISQPSSYFDKLRKFITDNEPDIQIDVHTSTKGIPHIPTNWQAYSIIIMDYDLGLKNETGLHWLATMQTYPYMQPIVILTDKFDININAKALKLGASNCLAKTDINPKNLTSIIDQSIASANNKKGSSRKTPKAHSDHTDMSDMTKSDIPEDGTLTKREKQSLSKDYPSLIVPGYELQRKIAEGGMTIVFEARRLDDNLSVVLKVLFNKNHPDPDALKRFMQEYNLIATIKHKHIIRIYERGFSSDFSYIALEYLPKGNLSKCIASKLSSTVALSYLRQIALGLSAIHKHNIVHRDLKPGNILLQDEHTLKIIDFGSAKIIDEDTEDMTTTTMLLGTPYYMSPEQCIGFNIDQRSDIYSAGVLFYMMLTNRRPFRANSVEKIIKAHTESPIPKLPTSQKKYQPLIEGMLAKKADDRFQCAADLLAGIDLIGQE